VTTGCGVADHRIESHPPQLATTRHSATRPGGTMEIHLIIGAGIAATAAIIAILLRLQNDPIEEQIREAMQYETKKSRTAKALRS